MGAMENVTTIKEYHLPAEAKEILHSLATKWEDVVDPNALQVIPLKGVMTNQVFQIKWPTKTEKLSRVVLIRIYGEGVDIFFDQNVEIRTFECMSKHKQGPRLLGRFLNGRIEEFIHARALSTPDLRNPDISARIATKMKEFHNLDMPGPKNVYLWVRLQNWQNAAMGLATIEEANNFQDYEYASYNSVAYDIANHFCEMASDYHTETPHIVDYSKYPGLEERQRFVYKYLSSLGGTATEIEVKQLVELVEKYTLASHLVWGLWGIISEHVNEIDFDYMEYARQRIQQYWLTKPLLLGSINDSPEAMSDGNCTV